MYYHNIWDPVLIVSQMATLQCAFYLSFGCALLLLHLLLSTPLSLSLMLDGDLIRLTRASGWTAIVAQLCAAPCTAYLILRVVGRAKKCLDFSASLFFLHYLVCVLYGGIPSSWQYYLVLAAALIVTVVVSEFLCMKEEMRWIPTAQAGGGAAGGGGGAAGSGSSGGGGGGGGGSGGGARDGSGGGGAGEDSGSVSVSGLLTTSVGSALSRLSGTSPRLVVGASGATGNGGAVGELELAIAGHGSDDDEDESVGLIAAAKEERNAAQQQQQQQQQQEKAAASQSSMSGSGAPAAAAAQSGGGSTKGRIARFKPL